MSLTFAGSIPLRQLVYRVLALPPSMQPLVYDFGQLTNTTEKDYTTQIVKNRVSICHMQYGLFFLTSRLTIMSLDNYVDNKTTIC